MCWLALTDLLATLPVVPVATVVLATGDLALALLLEAVAVVLLYVIVSICSKIVEVDWRREELTITAALARAISVSAVAAISSSVGGGVDWCGEGSGSEAEDGVTPAANSSSTTSTPLGPRRELPCLSNLAQRLLHHPIHLICNVGLLLG